MNIENKCDSPSVASFYQFMVLRMIKEDIFTLSVYVSTITRVQTTITVTVYS
jgi:hypothetical protein